MVMADLARELALPINMDWMALSPYGSGTRSSGVVRILKDLDSDLTDRRVLIVEDTIDSGPTLSRLLANLRFGWPQSVRQIRSRWRSRASGQQSDAKHL